MSQTNVNIRMDEGLKKDAEYLFSELGLNMTTAVNIFVRQAVRQGKIPFELTTKTDDDPFYSKKNQVYLKKAIEDLEAGKGLVVKRLDELEAMEGE
ncbi:type II toxin-antitoxin system RelB/DinJ family antitoxin [Synergistaceae bacterium OttesenSCG-928-I11]|nr:type II toxin-antitoxin system RelB/DinJ family antitoxin [Synergistaceae bacterium OttesenSCG-928-I11]